LVFFILNLIFGLLIEHPEVSFQISRFLCLLKPLGKQLENTFFCLNSNLGTIVFDRFEEEGHKHFEVRLHVLESEGVGDEAAETLEEDGSDFKLLFSRVNLLAGLDDCFL